MYLMRLLRLIIFFMITRNQCSSVFMFYHFCFDSQHFSIWISAKYENMNLKSENLAFFGLACRERNPMITKLRGVEIFRVCHQF